MKTLAKIISLILGPAILWPTTLFVFILKTEPEKQRFSIFFLLLFLQVVVPLSYIYLAYRRKKIHDLDLSHRQERYIPLTLAFFGLLVSLVFLNYFGSRTLVNFFAIMLVLLAMNGLVTFFWKISLHMALNVFSSFFINVLFAGKLPFLYLSLPLVFWARLELKKHTVPQLLGALILNTALILFLSLTLKQLFNFF